MNDKARQQRQLQQQRQQQKAQTDQYQRGGELPERQDQSHHNATPAWAKKQAASAGQ